MTSNTNSSHKKHNIRWDRSACCRPRFSPEQIAANALGSHARRFSEDQIAADALEVRPRAKMGDGSSPFGSKGSRIIPTMWYTSRGITGYNPHESSRKFMVSKFPYSEGSSFASFCCLPMNDGGQERKVLWWTVVYGLILFPYHSG